MACLVLIAANAFFVAGEFSLVAIDRVRLERDAVSSRPARRVQSLARTLSLTLASTQLGVTVASLLLGLLAAPSVERLLKPWLGASRGWSVALSLLLATILQTLLGEVLPKNVAIASADRVGRAVSLPLWSFASITRPIARIFHGIANRIVRALGVEPRDEIAPPTSLEELQFVIAASGEAGSLDPADVTLLTRTIRFGEKTAADALVPRPQIVAIRADATVTDLVVLTNDTGYSRYPVYVRDLDNIVGIVHAKSVFDVPREQRETTPVTRIMRDALAIPEGRELRDLMQDVRTTRTYMAVVVDEYGGTAGIITLEDVLEEIVGEIGDEYDEPIELTRSAETGAFLLPGSLHGDEVRELAGFEMPEGEYETLAGFILDRLGRLPQPGDTVRVDGWRFEVVAMDKRRIALVRAVAP